LPNASRATPETQGYAAEVGPLDDHAGSLPTDGAVAVVTASYEGHPPDNAKQFAAWLETLAPGALKGVRYTVFGCGNRQWARTYQAVPKRFDTALEAAGATRVRERGETDAGGDFFGDFDRWYEDLWRDLGGALGKRVQALPSGGQLEVEVLKVGRTALLRLADLQHGEVVVNRELVDMTSPLGRSKRHIEIALPDGMSYRAGDYLAVLPHNPIGVVMRALKRFDLASDTQIVIRKPEGSITSLPVDHPVNVSELLFHYVELGQPATRAQVTALAAATRAAPEQAELTALAEESAYQRDVLGKRVSVLDLLERYPSCTPGLAAFLEMLPPARARQYSISSSPLWNAQHCTLTVAIVDAPALSGRGRYQGMASSYLANCTPGTRVAIAVRSSNDHFHPPVSPETPMVMVCAGTGLSPFRGFLQERATTGAERAQRRPVAALLRLRSPGCRLPLSRRARGVGGGRHRQRAAGVLQAAARRRDVRSAPRLAGPRRRRRSVPSRRQRLRLRRRPPHGARRAADVRAHLPGGIGSQRRGGRGLGGPDRARDRTLRLRRLRLSGGPRWRHAPRSSSSRSSSTATRSGACSSRERPRASAPSWRARSHARGIS
jgi:cytochrome P450/NADPH-cytochrome P450 reductase